jgi:hypothetical protein
LSGNPSLIVRSSAVAARLGADTPDLKTLAADADVDRVVMGTLLRVGDQLRASAQLVEAPAGTLLTSHTVQSPTGDLFGLQDDIARRVAEALSLPLSGPSASPAPDAPHDARAYEFYLRGSFRQNVAGRVAPVGVPAHRSSPSPVRGMTCVRWTTCIRLSPCSSPS